MQTKARRERERRREGGRERERESCKREKWGGGGGGGVRGEKVTRDPLVDGAEASWRDARSKDGSSSRLMAPRDGRVRAGKEEEEEGINAAEDQGDNSAAAAAVEVPGEIAGSEPQPKLPTPPPLPPNCSGHCCS